MTECYRCGVEFDATPFRPGAPCIDCQEDIGGDWSNYWLKGGLPDPEKMRLREEDIRRLHKRAMTDPQIAAELGIHRTTVVKWRKRLKLPANATGGAQHWKDYAATIEKLRSPEHAQRILAGQRKGRNDRRSADND